MRRAISSWVLLLAACSGGGPPDAGAVGCVNDPAAETYSAGMKKVGDGARLSFVLVSADPAPPLRGNNSWVVQVLDAQGQSVSGATLTVTPFMPEHGHGSSVTPTVTAGSDGYHVTPLYLFMPGLWRVTIAATAGATSDSAAFTFCVAG